MRKPRKFLTDQPGTQYFHVVSRVVNRGYVLGEQEKAFFLKTMRKLEAFTGVEVLTYCVMSNHFHLLLKVPEAECLGDEAILKRMSSLYSRMTVKAFGDELEELRKLGQHEQVAQLRERMTCRMYDLSMFMKDLKQRFTQWFNRVHKRKGTLWEERFRSVLVEGSEGALMTVASYIDLNPVRAGLSKDPARYTYCGYGEAIKGDRAAQRGLERLAEAVGCSQVWEKWQGFYDNYLLEKDARRVADADGFVSHEGFEREHVMRVLKEHGVLSRWELLRCRVRYFSDGAVLGSRNFVDDFFKSKREYFGPKRTSGARRMKGGGWGELFTIRELAYDTIRVSLRE